MDNKLSFKYEYSMVIMMAVVWGFVGLNRIGIAFLFPFIVPYFHLNYLQAGLLISGTSGLWAVSSWLFGVLGDRYGKKRVFVPAMLFSAVMAALLGIAGGFAGLLLIRALIGVGDGVGASVGYSMVADISTPARRGLNMGIYSSGYTLAGAGVGALVITRIAASLGWQWVYPILGVGMVAFSLVVLRWFVDRSGTNTTTENISDTEQKISLWEVFKYRSFGLIVIINILTLTWMMVSNSFNALFLTKVHHLSPVMAGSVLAGAGILGFAGQWICPAVSDFIGRKPVVIGCTIISFCASLFFIFGSFSPVILAVFISIAGFFGWGQLPLTVAIIIGEAVPQRLHATAIGTSNFIAVIIGTFIMPSLGGWAADKWGLTSPLIIAAAAILLVAVFMVMVPESAPRRLKTGNVFPPVSAA